MYQDYIAPYARPKPPTCLTSSPKIQSRHIRNIKHIGQLFPSQALIPIPHSNTSPDLFAAQYGHRKEQLSRPDVCSTCLEQVAQRVFVVRAEGKDETAAAKAFSGPRGSL